MKNTHVLSSVLLVLALTGCASTKDTLVVKPQVVERPKLEIPAPAPVQQLQFEWVVITKENYEKKFKEIESRGGTVTLFALTPQGYQNLSMNVSELRRFMQQQQAIIAALKKYYEASDTKPAEK